MIKIIRKKSLFYFIALSFIWSANVAAEDFFDVIDYAVVGTGIDKKVDAEMYGARVISAWEDTDNDKNMDIDEFLTTTIKLYDRHGTLALESPSALNREGVKAWAEDHAKEILAIIFPGGLYQSVGVVDFRNNFLSFKGASDPKKKKQNEIKMLNNDFKAALEYLSIEVNGDDGDAKSILLGYGHETSSGLEFGLKLPYRYTSLDDSIDSESHYVGIDFYGKYPVKEWEDMVLNIGMDIFGSAFYLTSDAVEHAGNLEYGIGASTSLSKYFGFGTLTVGIDYNISTMSIDSSFVDTDDGFVESALEYINDLDPTKTLSYGFNLSIPFMEQRASANLEVIRSNFFGDDIENDRESQTLAGISISYYPTDTFELNLGVRQTFELEDIETTGIMLGAVYRY